MRKKDSIMIVSCLDRRVVKLARGGGGRKSLDGVVT